MVDKGRYMGKSAQFSGTYFEDGSLESQMRIGKKTTFIPYIELLPHQISRSKNYTRTEDFWDRIRPVPYTKCSSNLKIQWLQGVGETSSTFEAFLMKLFQIPCIYLLLDNCPKNHNFGGLFQENSKHFSCCNFRFYSVKYCLQQI